MKRTVLFLLMTAFLAGCASDAPEDATDDPAMGMPVPGSDVDDTEVLPTDDTRPADGQGFAPQTGRQESDNGVVRLVGDLSTACAADERFCIHAVATNEGDADLYVSDICVSPWSESMKQRDSTVQKSGPVAVCMAWGVRALAPGQQIGADLSWDGMLWDDDAQEYREAPQDSYTWSVHFAYYEGEDGSGSDELVLDFPVIIGET